MRGVAVGVLILGVALGLLTQSAAADIEPLIVGWERFFALDWGITEQRGRAVVTGYVRNTSPYTFGRVQLLADTLDGTSRVVAQETAWVPGALGPFDRRYFEIPLRTRGQDYRIRVLAFDRLEAALLQGP